MNVWDALADLLVCAENELETMGRPAQRVLVMPGGGIVEDDCCEHGGQLWTRLITTWPVNPLPVKQTSFTNCGHAQWGHLIAVGTSRCAHTMNERGQPPTVEQMTADAYGVICDQGALMRAICCAFADHAYVVDRFDSSNPSGGCVRAEWRIWVEASLVDCTQSPGEDSP